MSRLSVLVAFVILFTICFTHPSQAYDRDEWLPRWSDFDRDCQSTRHELLIQFSLAPVTFKPSNRGNCLVESGLWLDPYSGQYYTEATQVDIEHIIALSWADAHGGRNWSREKKRRFAEDPANLWVVSARYNRQKGDKGPDKWMPPYYPTRRKYVERYIALIDKYDLKVSPREKALLYRLAGMTPL